MRNNVTQREAIFESEGILHGVEALASFFDFEWLEFGAKPRRIRYYILSSARISSGFQTRENILIFSGFIVFERLET